MATVVGFVEQARALFPDFVLRRRRPRSEAANDVWTIGSPPPLARRSVADVVERVVVPQLADGARAKPVDHADIGAFVALSLDPKPDKLLARLETLIARGVPVDTILVDLLAPAARRLGELWEDDECDFVEVTMGLWRLQEAVREFSARVPAARQGGNRRALFAPMPGDQHNFGTIMVEDVFRRDGWTTELLLGPTRSELLDTLARSSFDMLGLTVSCDDHNGLLPSLVTAIRSVSRNPRLCIMLGGRVPVADPDIVMRVGADAMSTDARQAVSFAARLVAANACREVFTA